MSFIIFQISGHHHAIRISCGVSICYWEVGLNAINLKIFYTCRILPSNKLAHQRSLRPCPYDDPLRYGLQRSLAGFRQSVYHTFPRPLTTWTTWIFRSDTNEFIVSRPTNIHFGLSEGHRLEMSAFSCNQTRSS